jgi:hypothetical protein
MRGEFFAFSRKLFRRAFPRPALTQQDRDFLNALEIAAPQPKPGPRLVLTPWDRKLLKGLKIAVPESELGAEPRSPVNIRENIFDGVKVAATLTALILVSGITSRPAKKIPFSVDVTAHKLVAAPRNESSFLLDERSEYYVIYMDNPPPPELPIKPGTHRIDLRRLSRFLQDKQY